MFVPLAAYATVCKDSTARGRKQQVEILASNSSHIVVAKALSFNEKTRQHELEILETLKGKAPLHRQLLLDPAEYTEWDNPARLLQLLQINLHYLLFLKQTDRGWELVLPGLSDSCPEQGSGFLPRGGLKLSGPKAYLKTETYRSLRDLKLLAK